MKKIIQFGFVFALAAKGLYAQVNPTKALELTSILVDACNATSLEQNNEMFTFKVGPNPLNTASLTIASWSGANPANPGKWPGGQTWMGITTNPATTASLQATITNGCGKLIEPIGGVLPRYANVLMVTSNSVSTTDNSFATLTDTLYIIYHNAIYSTSTGHFVNSPCVGQPLAPVPCAWTGTTSPVRNMKMIDLISGQSDTVWYNSTLLINSTHNPATQYGGTTAQNDGATVDYAWPGYPTATYINNGCMAPFIPLSASANASSATVCNTATVGLSGTAGGTYTATVWSGGAGTIANTHSLNTIYTPAATENGLVTFTLTVYGKCAGTTETSTVSVFINAAPSPSVSSSGGASFCSGNSTVLSASATGTLATTYSWAPVGATTNTLAVNNPSVGMHVYTVTAGNSCGSKSMAYTITVNALPSLTTTNDSVCVSGTGTVTAMGASSYTWSLGAVHTSTLAAAVGIYTVSGTNASGCVGTATAQVVSVALPAINTNISATCKGVPVLLTATGGFSYTWTPGAVLSSSLSITPSTTTPIVVTGAGVHGCTNTHTVVVNNTPAISVNNPISCSGNAVTLQASPASLSSYTWTGVSSSVSSATVAPLTTSSYTVQATDVNGCISNAVVSTVSITAAAPISVASSDNIPCIGSTYTLSANGATTYTWVASSGTFTSLNGNNTQISVNQGSSAITFTVLGTGSCPATPTIVTINPAPVTTVTISASPSTSVCTGNAVTCTAGGASTYTWTPSITNGVAFTPTTSATYTVHATDINGCLASTSLGITVYNTPTITVNSPSDCAGNAVTLQASPASLSSYTWTGVSSSVSSATVAPLTTSSYTVQATDAHGCVSNAAVSSVSVTAATPVLVTSSNYTPCVGATYTLSANGATTYTWIASSGTFTSLNGNNTQISVNQGSSAVTFTVLGAGSCPATPTVLTINPQAPSTLSVSSTPVCFGNNVSFTAMGASSYTWMPSSSHAATFVTGASNGQSFTVTAIDANGCLTIPVVTTATVYALPVISITASSNTVCAGSTVTLTASGATSYTWNTGTQSNPFTDSPTAAAGYTVAGTDNNGCVSIATTSVGVSPLPVAQTISGSTVLCVGTSVALSAPVSGVWIGPAPATTTLGLGTSVNITKGGTYTFHNINNCGDAVSTYTVIADSLKANFAANPLSGQIPLHVTCTNASVGGSSSLSYTWSFGSGNTSNATNPTEVYQAAGTYPIILLASDGFCSDTATAYITASNVPSVLIIPNIFTPNGDGINDGFLITATNITNFECSIYDRWGLLLYSWNGVDGYWDGKAKNGTLCTDGTYYYMLTYTDSQGNQQKKEGFLELLR
ncbi:MAG: gliding motility-associated C-terminal domain-containing protein [Bacteroidetes bacterium]|nr:gliding motility-associated C-terminal domain-containing protein [Bacteroidota bacterium]